MMTKPAHFLGRSHGGTARPARGWMALLVVPVMAICLLVAGPAMAANTLQSVSASPLPGGKVQVTLSFSGPAVAPQAFSTNTPPRIALDFADTSNGLAQRSYNLGQGTAQSVSAVEANGRTRVVVNLSQPSPYVTQVQGNQLLVTIGDGMGSATAAADPAQDSGPALAPVPPPPQSQQSLAVSTANPDKAVAMAGSNVITGVDFQRGDHGGGKLVVDFSQAGAATSMHTNGDVTTIDVAGANLAAAQARRLDVTSYATPVRSVNTHAVPGGARIDVETRGVVQTASYQTGNQYVVEFSRPTSSETTLLGAPKPIVYKGSRVTFNFQDIPVRSVLQLLADVSNLNIVASDSVQGNVTLRLVNVPWDQALDVILRAKGLAQRQNGNVIWVAPQTEIAKYEQDVADARQKQLDSAQLVTDYIPINYGNAKQIADLLTSGAKAGNVGGGGGVSSTSERGFLSSRGSVSFDDRTNTLLVNDTPEKVQEIRQLVSVLDRPVKQVLIESRLVIATDNFTRELGAKLGVGGFHLGENSKHAQVYGGGINGVNGTGTSDTTSSIANYWNSFSGQSTGTGNNVIQIPTGLNVNLPSTTTGSSSFAIGILGRDYLLNLELSAAQQEGRSETISQPKVVTANNQEATIQQGQQIGYLTFQNSGAGGGQGTATVQFKNAVLELDVTPTITSDNRVFMKLKVIKDAISALVPNPGGGFVPQIDHREIDTSVLVDNGQTVVLGGVYEFTNEHDVTKVPFLGDIPILGALFRDKKNINNKAELLVFITPHILGQETTVE
ncbi:MAG: Type IV pilus biogenesis protein PilQ [Rhodanobacteraceae bacterium]|jgi:type IV pilus assembly protein PilQ|nr:MAG: Type IV pilus biogenesis protein PilQ [Rhodanobacteraceae bacterium]